MKNNSFDQYLFIVALLIVGALFLGSNPGIAQSFNSVTNNSDNNQDDNPAAPTELTAAAGNGQVNLHWTAGTGDTSYSVLRSTVSGHEGAIAAPITATNYTDSAVTNGQKYYYMVVGNYAGGGATSSEVSATPQSISAIAQLFQQASTAINTYNSSPSLQNLTSAQAQVALLQPYNTITLAMINFSSSTLGVYDAANRSLASVLFIHANTAISIYNSTPSSQNLTSAQGQIALLQPYNTITLAMINFSNSTLDVYDAANQSLASVLFVHANTAISTYNSTPSSQNLTSAQGQIALLLPYNTITLAMINFSNSTLDVYDAANQSLASVLFIHANTAISTYNSTPSSQNLTSAQGQIVLLQPYNKITLAMINFSNSTLDIYDAANRSLASVLFIHANTAISTYNSTPSSQNLTSAQGQIALLQPYNTITLAMINFSSSTLGVYDAANRSLASVLFIHANTAISTYNSTPSSQNLTSAQGQIALLQPYNTITLAMINFSSSTLGVYDAANRSLASVLFIHANTAISTYNSTPSSQNLTSAQGQIALLQPYNTITLAMINFSSSTLDVYDAANRSLASVLFIHANTAISTYNSTPSSQNLASAVAQVYLLQPFNSITVKMILPSSQSNVGVFDQELNVLITDVITNLQKVDMISLNAAPTGAESFAVGVAVHGDDLLVSDPQADGSTGLIDEYVKTSGQWLLKHTLQPLDAQPNGNFATSIVEDKQGNLLAVIDNPANTSESPSLYLFNNSNVTANSTNNQWVQEDKINLEQISGLSPSQLKNLSMAMDNGLLVIGIPSAQRVLVFSRTPAKGGPQGSWQFETTIVPNISNSGYQFNTLNFGASVDVSSTNYQYPTSAVIAVGAPSLGNSQVQSRVIFYSPHSSNSNSPYSSWYYLEPVTFVNNDPGFGIQVQVGDFLSSIVVGDWSGNAQDPGKILLYNATLSSSVYTWSATPQQLTVVAPLTGAHLGNIVKVNGNQMVIDIQGGTVTAPGETTSETLILPMTYLAVYQFNAAGDNNWDWQYTNAVPVVASPVDISGSDLAIGLPTTAALKKAGNNGAVQVLSPIVNTCVPVTVCSATLNCGTDSCGNPCGTCSSGTCSSSTSGTPGTCKLSSTVTSSILKIR